MTTKAALKALERIFVAEINGHLPLQSKAKIYERMEADGLVQRYEKRFRDRSGEMVIAGWCLTHAGRFEYCRSCDDAEDGVMATPTFREPTSELPDVLSFGSDWQTWLRQYDDERITLSQDDATGLDSECVILDVPTAEALLEVLLDICPNAYALAHNFLLERQKAEHMKGGGS